MNELTKQSINDLTRRLRVAGDEYHDLRVTIWRKIEAIDPETSYSLGGTFGSTAFWGESGGTWRTTYSLEILKPKFSRRPLPWFSKEGFIAQEERIAELAPPVLIRTERLFSDACRLASDIGFDRIPGIEGIDPTGFRRGESLWLLLLFHAAWTSPKGSLLRASRLQAEDHVAAGGFFSTLPIDPFTASAALLELMVQGNGEPDPDGPYGACQWRQDGVVIEDSMQKKAWRMVDYLWGQEELSASFDELQEPVYDDREYEADFNEFGGLRNGANRYFRKHGIPWKVGTKDRCVFLSSKEKIGSIRK